MKAIVMCVLLVGTIGHVGAQDHPPLEVAPLFSNVSVGPAFMLTCVNEKATLLQLGQGVPDITVRVDGQLVPQHGTAGIGGGTVVQPGSAFKVMIVLFQEQPTSWTSPAFGALLRIGQSIPLSQGLHSVQFQCFGRTSPALSVYWEHPTTPR